MSETLIFVAGSVVFAATTAATLIYGYLTFNARAEDEGVPGEGVERRD